MNLEKRRILAPGGVYTERLIDDCKKSLSFTLLIEEVAESDYFFVFEVVCFVVEL